MLAELTTEQVRLDVAQTILAARLALFPRIDDCECLEADEVAHLLKCSVDLVRERGEGWGIAKTLACDARGRPTRVVYPKALIRAYLYGSQRSGSAMHRKEDPS